MSSDCSYVQRPIGTREALARTLRCSLEDLLAVSSEATQLYRPVTLKKKDGSPRHCFDAFAQLKQIQGRINSNILSTVQFPKYLTGGLKERSHFKNAVLHAHSKFAISEDIRGFFPSISSDLVFDVWLNFFRFSPDVAGLLTLLTTKSNCLPEGARTSTYLANLVFWRSEPKIYEQLSNLGFRYSRHVDDITISSLVVPPKKEIETAIEQITAMVIVKGMSLKRKKHRISFSGQRRESTGLLIDRDGALPSNVRAAVRSQVYNCEQLCHSDSPMASEAKTRAHARVGQLKRFHPKLAQSLKERLRRM